MSDTSIRTMLLELVDGNGAGTEKHIKGWPIAVEVMNMTVTLETIHKDILQVKSELHRIRNMLENQGEPTDEARRDLATAREQMDNGKYDSHEEVMAKYG